MRNIVSIIPAYRPNAALPVLVVELRARVAGPIVVVDDGSGPAYAALFASLRDEIPGVTVLRHETNRGKGAALKTGLAHALSLPGLAGAVTLDSDGQHRPQDAARIGADLARNDGRLILGGRFVDAARVPWRSRIGNLVTRRVFHLLTGVALTDSQTGLRGIPAAMIPVLLRLPANGYEFETEMLLMAAARGWAIATTPIATVYLDGNAGSHFDPVRDSFRIYAALAHHAVGSIKRRRHAYGPETDRAPPQLSD